MEGNKDKIMEALIRRSMRKALRKATKEIENWPTTVIESADGEADVSEETMTEIRAWLFKRRLSQ
ncbi:MAG: hypothetical protein FJ012_11275 [Chloroflexi bacterium]|nr:hypothetical protein [Chloroflexota bacterium]